MLPNMYWSAVTVLIFSETAEEEQILMAALNIRIIVKEKLVVYKAAPSPFFFSNELCFAT